MVRSVIAVAIACLISIAGPASLQAREIEPTRQAAASASKPPAPLNLNTATVAELEKLPGVGAATAARIIEYRDKNGAFKKIEELMNVKGIGEKAFLKLKPLVTVAAPKSHA